MKSIATHAVIIAAFALSGSAMAADYLNLRPSYPDQWATAEDNPLRFEMGARYWYSKGGQEGAIGAQSVKTEDTSHLLEGHFRIEDPYTSSFLKGAGGYAIATDGQYSSSLGADTTSFSGGQIGHVGADFGYMPLGSENIKFGALIGYQYLRESPDKARSDILKWNALNVHALRLGVTAKADLGSFADITGEVVGIPYAWVNGTTPSYVIPSTTIGGVPADRVVGDVNGSAYGASGELMLGIHPSENLTIRLGGRGWMLTGPANANVTYSAAADPTKTHTSGVMMDTLSLFRYGALLEVTGRF